MKPTVLLMKAWYDEYRKKYFNNEIPTSDDVMFEITKTKSRWGDCSMPSPKTNNKFKIRLSAHSIREEKSYRQTMIHEMIHVYAKLKHNEWGHGKYFKEMCEVINKDGWNLARTTSREKTDKVDVLKRYDVLVFMKENDDKIYLSKVMSNKVSLFKAWIKMKPKMTLITHLQLEHQDLENMTSSRSRLHFKGYERKEIIKKYPRLKNILEKWCLKKRK